MLQHYANALVGTFILIQINTSCGFVRNFLPSEKKKKKKNGTLLANVFDPFFWFLLFLLRIGNFRDDDYADLDWDNLGFGIMPTDYMYLMKCSKGEDFEQGQLNRYGNIELGPAAGVLNYGQVNCK